MQHEGMDQLIEGHLRAERAGDSVASVVIYTDGLRRGSYGR